MPIETDNFLIFMNQNSNYLDLTVLRKDPKKNSYKGFYPLRVTQNINNPWFVFSKKEELIIWSESMGLYSYLENHSYGEGKNIGGTLSRDSYRTVEESLAPYPQFIKDEVKEMLKNQQDQKIRITVHKDKLTIPEFPLDFSATLGKDFLIYKRESASREWVLADFNHIESKQSHHLIKADGTRVANYHFNVSLLDRNEQHKFVYIDSEGERHLINSIYGTN